MYLWLLLTCSLLLNHAQIYSPDPNQNLMLAIQWPRKYHRAVATHLQQSCGKYLPWNLSKAFPVCHFFLCVFPLLCRCVWIGISGYELSQSACKNGLWLEKMWKITFSVYPLHRNYQRNQSLGHGGDAKYNRNTFKRNTQNKEGAFLQLSAVMGIPCCISHYMLSH